MELIGTELEDRQIGMEAGSQTGTELADRHGIKRQENRHRIRRQATGTELGDWENMNRIRWADRHRIRKQANRHRIRRWAN